MARWSHRIRAADMQIDIDLSELKQLTDELKSTTAEVGKATSRALRRTATHLQKLSRQELKRELDLPNVTLLRKRMKTMRARIKGGDVEKVIGIWYGLNDLPVSAFKYKPGPIQHSWGASFGQHEFPGAFVARLSKRKGKRSIYRRASRGRFPLTEQTIPIKDIADTVIEDRVFPKATQFFVRTLFHELRYQASQRNKDA